MSFPVSAFLQLTMSLAPSFPTTRALPPTMDQLPQPLPTLAFQRTLGARVSQSPWIVSDEIASPLGPRYWGQSAAGATELRIAKIKAGLNMLKERMMTIGEVETIACCFTLAKSWEPLLYPACGYSQLIGLIFYPDLGIRFNPASTEGSNSRDASGGKGNGFRFRRRRGRRGF